VDTKSGPYLKTLGSSALIGAPPPGSVPLRAKDLALLVYLCVQGPAKPTRSALATLLWGDRDEVRARHSLTQALRRLRLRVGEDAFALDDRFVEWRGELACDALELERAAIDPAAAESGLPCYSGDFLVDLALGQGTEGFTNWADGRRVHFRFAAARVLTAQGNAAEELGRWDTALQLGLRHIEIEPMSQQAHRRVMRAWSALGERPLAVRHYHQFERWLQDEWGELPDPATRALFDQLRTDRSPNDATAAHDGDGGMRQQRAFFSNNVRISAPIAQERTVRATSANAPALVTNGQHASEDPSPEQTSPADRVTPPVTTWSANARSRFVVAVTVVVLGVVAIFVAFRS